MADARTLLGVVEYMFEKGIIVENAGPLEYKGKSYEVIIELREITELKKCPQCGGSEVTRSSSSEGITDYCHHCDWSKKVEEGKNV